MTGIRPLPDGPLDKRQFAVDHMPHKPSDDGPPYRPAIELPDLLDDDYPHTAVDAAMWDEMGEP